MNFKFQGKRISGVSVVLPPRELFFLDEMKNFNFPEARSLKLKEVMGYNKRRVVEPNVCVSDLAVFGMQQLFDQGLLKREDIDALLLVTQTPDHFMPATSSLIQGRLGLKQDMFCQDINQACAGFVIGLMQAFMLLDQESIKKVVLINADVLSRKASPKDRNIYPLIGDAASITVIERDPTNSVIHASLKTDGSRAEVLIIPAGGMRMPSTPETASWKMSVTTISGRRITFSWTVRRFSILCRQKCRRSSRVCWSGQARPKSRWIIFSATSRIVFMLEKLAEKMKIPFAKMPNNVVENFGNSGSVTIPTVMAFNLGERLRREKFRVCLAGFGGGLAWSAMLLDLGNMSFNHTIEYIPKS